MIELFLPFLLEKLGVEGGIMTRGRKQVSEDSEDRSATTGPEGNFPEVRQRKSIWHRETFVTLPLLRKNSENLGSSTTHETCFFKKNIKKLIGDKLAGAKRTTIKTIKGKSIKASTYELNIGL